MRVGGTEGEGNARGLGGVGHEQGTLVDGKFTTMKKGLPSK